jgi:trans-2,3-dihydro-3-hydroxyanthranilate isomerase
MRPYSYFHVDVFTTTPFEGNQLAVFTAPDGLTSEEMQLIAHEMNFSESTFVFAPEKSGTDVRMRIFTPAEELPIAGHPTIGTTFALAHEGRIAPGRETFVFGLNAGPTPVSLAWNGADLAFAWMTQPLPSFGPRVRDRAAMTAALGVEAVAMVADWPIETVSCGVPFLFVPLATRTDVDRVRVNEAAYGACLRDAGLDVLPLFVFTLDRTGAAGDETAYSRMLAPGFGITEDPATGIASGALGSYLAEHGSLADDRLREFVSLQGVAMKRPSRIHISIERSGDRIRRVRVGGRAVLLGTGQLRVP